MNIGPDLKSVTDFFHISQPKHMLWVLKDHLNETLLLSTQNTCLN